MKRAFVWTVHWSPFFAACGALYVIIKAGEINREAKLYDPDRVPV